MLDSYYYIRDSNKDRNGNGIQSNELNNSYVEGMVQMHCKKSCVRRQAAKPALAELGLAYEPEKECRG